MSDMRRWSSKFILVGEYRYYLVSIKPEGEGWDRVGFARKSKEKDEFGFKMEGEHLLSCPHKGNIPSLAWWPLPDSWISVPRLCQKCWGSIQQPMVILAVFSVAR
jgi:hypothetical protein